MPTNTKFTQRNDAAGKMTGAQVAMGVATGRMSAKDVANAMGKPAKSATTPAKPSAPTKSSATKTTGSYKKPTTPPTKSTMKTQNIPEVTVSATKKKVTGTVTKPTTPPVKEAVNTNRYVQRTAGGDYIELTAKEHSRAVALQKAGKAPKGSNLQTLSASKYEEGKKRIAPVGSKAVTLGGQSQETILSPSQYEDYMSRQKGGSNYGKPRN